MNKETTLMNIYHETPTEATPMTSLIERCNKAIAKPISKLSVEDICTFVRQGFYKEVIVPMAIDILSKKIEAGGDWEAELLQAVVSAKEDYFSIEQIETIKKITSSYSRSDVIARLIKENGDADYALSVAEDVEKYIAYIKHKYGF